SLPPTLSEALSQWAHALTTAIGLPKELAAIVAEFTRTRALLALLSVYSLSPLYAAVSCRPVRCQCPRRWRTAPAPRARPTDTPFQHCYGPVGRALSQRCCGWQWPASWVSTSLGTRSRPGRFTGSRLAPDRFMRRRTCRFGGRSPHRSS